MSATQTQPPIPEEINGLRMTRQRQEVYRILNSQLSHPTANEVFTEIRLTLPNTSLATVYNCLEALVAHHIIRQVNFDREPSRYCPNLEEHGHFHDETSGMIYDIKLKPGIKITDLLEIPPNTLVRNIDLTLRGKLAQ